MITTGIIAFREFLEAFLIVGVFVAVSKELRLHREKEIVTASVLGMAVSLLLSLAVYFFGERARQVFTEQNADVFEGYLLVISGLFIAYVIFSLHSLIQKKRDEMVKKAQLKLRNEMFDISLFFTVMFLVMREGVEIALFTASVSLFSAFLQNVIGLLAGFVLSALFGILAMAVYGSFPIQKVFRLTEYLIVLIGAAITQHGITILASYYFHLDLSRLGALGFSFLPDEDTLAGHLLQGFTGLDREISVARVLIMAAYVGLVYLIFFRKRKNPLSPI